MKTVRGIIVGLLAIALTLSAAACSGGRVDIDNGGAYDGALMALFEGLLSGDGELYYSAFPPRMKEVFEDMRTVPVFHGCDTMSGFLEGVVEEWERYCGKNVCLSIDVESDVAEPVIDSDDKHLDHYTYQRFVTTENTEEMRKLELELEFEGDGGEKEESFTVYVVKQNGKWYVHPVFVFSYFLTVSF